MTENHFITSLTPELYCSNIKTSLRFYTGVLGFTIQYQREEDRFAMLERQGARIMLDEIPNPASNVSGRVWLLGPLELPYGRGINLEIKTNNIDELYSDVKNSDATIFLPIEEKWYRANDIDLGCRQFIVIDPDGYMLRFSQSLGLIKGVRP